MASEPAHLLFTPVDHDPLAGPRIVAVAPITEAQREIWLACQMDADATRIYNEATEIRLRGPLNLAALETSWRCVVARHEALRACFSPDGEWICILEKLDFPMPFADLSECSAEQRQDRLAELRVQQVHTAFELERGPLFTLQVVKLDDLEHRVFFTAHHIIVDGWSAAEIHQDIARHYDALNLGRQPEPPTAESFAAFARDERAWRDSAEGLATAQYWLSLFPDGVPSVALPTDRPRGIEQTQAGARVDQKIGPELVARLRRTGAAQGASLVATMLATLGVMLGRLGGTEDVVVGLAASAQSFLGKKGLVGHAVNLLPLRTQVSAEQTFAQYLRQVRGTLLDAFDHQRITFGSLLSKLKVDRDPSRPPAVPVVFNIDVRNDPICPQGLDVTYQTLVREVENFELYINVVDDGLDLTLEASFNRGLFDAQTIARWLDAWRQLIADICERPTQRVGELSLLQPGERERLLAPPLLAHPPVRLLHEWFGQTVASHPDAIAVRFEEASLTYAQLEGRANQLANALKKRGVGPETLVALCLERSLDTVVAILGVLKAGGAYLPMDPATPAERIHFILDDAAAGLALTQTEFRDRFPGSVEVICLDRDWESQIAAEPVQAPVHGATPDNLVYVIYTSGSTGQPKGCMLTHANVSRLFSSTHAWYQFGPSDVWTLFHSYAFDFSVWELWGALLYGGRLVIVPYWASRDPARFYGLLADEGVTILNQTPSAFTQLIEAEGNLQARPLSLRKVIFGGEALEFQSLRPWFERHGDQQPQLVNMYGITETTVHVTYRPVSLHDLDSVATRSLIGQPIPDLSLYVLDPRCQPVTLGVTGELYVGGAGVARGYLNREELTRQRFIEDPHHPGQRLYRTGDLARLVPGAGGQFDLEYLGRIDHQVKLRGFRIELGEIEACLASHPAIAHVACAVRERTTGDARLVAWCVPRAGAAFNAGELREHLRAGLPAYMVPQHLIPLEHLPLTSNGKLDRRALPDPFGNIGGSDQVTKVPLRSGNERFVADLMREILATSVDIGRDDRFTDLGGHSLLAVRVAARLSKLAGRRLPMRAVLIDTVAGLASFLPDEHEISESAVETGTAPDGALTSTRDTQKIRQQGFLHRWFKRQKN